MFCSHKSSHIILLITVVNANYHFALFDIGNSGLEIDMGAFSGSNVGLVMNSTKKLKQYSTARKKYVASMNNFLVYNSDKAFSIKPFLSKP